MHKNKKNYPMYVKRRLRKLEKRRTDSRRLGGFNPYRDKKNKISSSVRYTLINFLENKNFKCSIKSEEKVKILIPEAFSISTNPDETINIFKSIYSYGMDHSITHIEFDHKNCKTIGVSASTIMDVIIMNIIKHRDRIGIPLDISGSINMENHSLYKMLRISGLLKHLKIKIPKENDDRYFKFLSLIHNNSSSQVASQVIRYLKHCLISEGLKFTPEGKGTITEMVGEIIDNCEYHTGEFADWYALGHFEALSDDNCGKCMLTIFDFGNTIYESLNSDETTEYTRNSLNTITKKHISYFKNDWTKENLWTLYSLQEGVSRMKNPLDPDQQSRGSGTIRFLDALQIIGHNNSNHKSLLSVLSGSTQIILDGTYKLEDKIISNKSVKIIAFNKDNDLDQLPDNRFVKKINSYFPGTIISIQFYIDNKYVIETNGGRNETN